MVANQITSIGIDEKGQSLIEVLILIPFLFMFVGLLYKVNMATQMAIVNTQYAHSQVYVLNANSPEYPRLQFRLSQAPPMFAYNSQDRMLLGVADPTVLPVTTAIPPVPQTQKIGRNSTTVGGSSDSGELPAGGKRTELRVRNTSGICTQLNMLSKSIPSGLNDRWPFHVSVCQYQGDPL